MINSMKPNKHILPLLSVVLGLVSPAMAQEQAAPPAGQNALPPAAQNTMPLGEIIGRLATEDNIRHLLENVDLDKLMADGNIQKRRGNVTNIDRAPTNNDAVAPPRRLDNAGPSMRMLWLNPNQNGQANDKVAPNDGAKSRARGKDQRGGVRAGAWRIGVACIPVDDMLREHLNLPKDTGVIITAIENGSPAAKAGIKTHDIVTSANQQQIGSLPALAEAVQKAGSEGKPLVLDTLHQGQSCHVTVQPQGPPHRMHADKPLAPRPMAGAMTEQAQQIQKLSSTVAKQQHAIDQLRKEVRKLVDQNNQNMSAPTETP